MMTLSIVNGDIQLNKISNATALKQRILNRLTLYLGEWFLDTSIGVNWFSVSKNTDTAFIQNLITTELRKEENITQINSVEVILIDTPEKAKQYNKPRRSSIVNLSVNTIYGTLQASI